LDLRRDERDTIRTRELAGIIGKLLRIRLFMVSAVSLLLLSIIAVEGASWTMVLLSLLIVPLIAIVYYDYRRIGVYRAESVPQDLAIVVSVQTLVICLTGGAESPVLFVYFMVAIGSGIALGWTRPALLVIAYLSAMLWLVALLGFAGALPKLVPNLLDIGPGHVERRLYVAASFIVFNMLLFAMFRVGTLIHDTTNRMLDRAIGARESALQTLADRNAELMRLSSAIAHELKNPLASVQGLVQLLKRGDKNTAQRLEVLEREVSRMRDTLDEFLNFSRPIGDLSVEQIEMGALLRDLTSLHDGLTEKRGIRVVLPDAEPGRISADRRKIQQALINLLQNAIEATPDGGRIEWIARERGGRLELGVSDSGPGIEPAILERLSRGAGATTKASGSGIGLAVARTIAEQHGGSLVMENRAEGGCRALLSLPKAASS
jgi:signal transduction histidine kinase